MKSKIPLLLMEQMVMLLVFALAAGLCLQAFVLSDKASERSNQRDRAVTVVQEVAETVRHCGGVAGAAGLLGAAYSDGVALLCYDADWNPGETEQVQYVLRAEEIPSGVPGLGMAKVTAEPCAASAEALFEATVAWQEPLPGVQEVAADGT